MSAQILKVETIDELNALAEKGELRGIVSVSSELYHMGPGVSSTGLKEILKSPAHYQAYLDDQSDSESFRFGRLVHMRLLEPELYARTVAVEPQADGRTSAGKAIKAQFAAASIGKEVITAAESRAIEDVASAAAANRLASKILSPGGSAEISVYWTDETTGVLCKARADLIKAGTIFDLKTCYSAAPKPFQRAVVDYGYHVSAAFYLDGFATVMPELTSFAWLAIEKKAPNAMAFYAAAEDLLMQGRADYQRALEVYAECQRTNAWPGFPQEFLNVSLGGF